MGICVECAGTGSLYLAPLEPRLMLLLISHGVLFDKKTCPLPGCGLFYCLREMHRIHKHLSMASYLYLGKAWLTRGHTVNTH